jgi:hypothetical protein
MTKEAQLALHRKTEKERQIADGGGGGRGAKSSYDNEKAWSSINYSILFVYICVAGH